MTDGPCSFCGWCETPERCVWSVSCPKCAADPKEQCRGAGGRMEGLHEERWHAAGLDWRAPDWDSLAEVAAVVLDVPVTYDARVVDSVTYLLDEWESLRQIEEEQPCLT